MPASSIKRACMIALSCFGLLCYLTAGVGSGQTEPESMVSDSRYGSESNTMPTDVHLFFTDDRNYFLKAEKQTLPLTGDPVTDGRRIIDQLLQGPKEGLHRIIPDATQVRSFFVTPDGTAYADFSESLRDKHPGGSRTELLTVFSIVNSLILNIPDIRQVMILIEGQETLTLAGHIDTRYPYKADMLLIR